VIEALIEFLLELILYPPDRHEFAGWIGAIVIATCTLGRWHPENDDWRAMIVGWLVITGLLLGAVMLLARAWS
jgi:uncharacterized membrane protein